MQQNHIQYYLELDEETDNFELIGLEHNGDYLGKDEVQYLDVFDKHDIPSAISETYQFMVDYHLPDDSLGKLSKTKFIALDITLEYRDNLLNARDKYGDDGWKDEVVAGVQTGVDWLASWQMSIKGGQVGGSIGSFVGGPLGAGIGGGIGFIGGAIAGSNLLEKSGGKEFIGDLVAKSYDKFTQQFFTHNEENFHLFDSVNEYKDFYIDSIQKSFLSNLPSFTDIELKIDKISHDNHKKFQDIFENYSDEFGFLHPQKEQHHKENYTSHFNQIVEDAFADLHHKLDEIKSDEEINLDDFEHQIEELSHHALDKISKTEDYLDSQLNHNLTKDRSLEEGFEAYIWKTQGDDKVRGEHAQLDGKVMVWGEGKEPGEDFGCRCEAEPSDLTEQEVREVQEDYGDWFQEFIDSDEIQTDTFTDLINNDEYEGYGGYYESGGISHANQFYDNSSGEWVQDSNGNHKYDLDDLVDHLYREDNVY